MFPANENFFKFSMTNKTSTVFAGELSGGAESPDSEENKNKEMSGEFNPVALNDWQKVEPETLFHDLRKNLCLCGKKSPIKVWIGNRINL